MRRLLPAGVWTQGAEVRDDLRTGAEGAIGLDREDGHGPSRVVGRQQIFSAGENGDVRGLAAGPDRIQKPQRPGIRIDGEGGRAAGPGFVSGVEELLCCVEDDEGRAADRREDAGECQFVRRGS